MDIKKICEVLENKDFLEVSDYIPYHYEIEMLKPTVGKSGERDMGIAQGSLILSNLASAKSVTFNGTVNLNGTVNMVPTQVQLGHYGTINGIYESLAEFGQILRNYTSANGNPTTIPLININLSGIPIYQAFTAEFTFDSAQITNQLVNSNMLTVYPTLTTNNNNLTLNLEFSGVIGLHIEPQYNNGYGGCSGIDSCILNPHQSTTTNGNVSTTYPSGSYTFPMTYGTQNFSFTINTSNTTAPYTILIQGYIFYSSSLENND